MNCTPSAAPRLQMAPPHPPRRRPGQTPRLAERREASVPTPSDAGSEPRCYTPSMVRKYLEFGAEMEELYRAAFVVSSWPSRDLRSATGLRTYPARFGLLSSKWDMDRAIGQLAEFPRAVLHLRYRAH